MAKDIEPGTFENDPENGEIWLHTQILFTARETLRHLRHLQSLAVVTRSQPSLPPERPTRMQAEHRPESRSTRHSRPRRRQGEHGEGMIRERDDPTRSDRLAARFEDDSGMTDLSEGEADDEEEWYQGRN
jgi:hypothetical protein